MSAVFNFEEEFYYYARLNIRRGFGFSFFAENGTTANVKVFRM